MNDEAELIGMFWESIPDRVTEATDCWLAIERGEHSELAALRRLLHSVKGEAQMFALSTPAELTESAESVVDRIRATEEIPEGAGNALLLALEALGALVPGQLPGEQAEELALEAIATLESLSASDSEESAVLQSGAESTTSSKTDSERQAVPVHRLEPVVSELRRLYSQQALHYPRLTQRRNKLRSLLRPIEPKATPERLSE
ncbi:MAG: Hpt domain-containing protein, partial [Myxococcota bacterium]